MEGKHTEGPWKAEINASYYIRAPHGGAVATLGFLRGPFGSKGRIRHEEGIANAHLIAAAPDLLEACGEALDMSREQCAGCLAYTDEQDGAWSCTESRACANRGRRRRIAAAIAKAKGE